MATALWAIGLVLLASFVGSSGPIFLKKFSPHLTFHVKSFLNKWFFLGVLAYGFGTVAFIPALKGGDLSVLYPLVATTYIWVNIWSVKWLHERMNKKKLFGLLLVLVGVLLVSV